MKYLKIWAIFLAVALLHYAFNQNHAGFNTAVACVYFSGMALIFIAINDDTPKPNNETTITLDFQSVNQPPANTQGGDMELGEFVLWNQCDGFHIANSAYFEDGEFSHFTDFTGQYSWNANDFQAWARLPDVETPTYNALHEKFQVRNPEANNG